MYFSVLVRINWSPRPFRVFNIWFKEDSLKNALASKLTAEEPINIQSILRKDKQLNKNWNKDWNGNIFKMIEEVELRIAELDDPVNPVLELELAKEELEKLLIRDSKLRKQARVCGWNKRKETLDFSIKPFKEVVQGTLTIKQVVIARQDYYRT